MEQNILHIKEVDSTNDFLKSLQNANTLKPPFCVNANFQTGGKGQRGNSWSSEAGKNLLCSFLVDGKRSAEELPLLNLAAVSALINTLKDFGIHHIKIKWPNDIYIGDMKIAGTLIENVFDGSSSRFSIVGIGLNVNQLEFGDISACSMSSLSSKQFKIESVLSSLYNQFYQQVQTSPNELLNFVNAHLYKRGKSVTFMHRKKYNEYKIIEMNLKGSLVVEAGSHFKELEHHNYKWIK